MTIKVKHFFFVRFANIEHESIYKFKNMKTLRQENSRHESKVTVEFKLKRKIFAFGEITQLFKTHSLFKIYRWGTAPPVKPSWLRAWVDTRQL